MSSTTPVCGPEGGQMGLVGWGLLRRREGSECHHRGCGQEAPRRPGLGSLLHLPAETPALPAQLTSTPGAGGRCCSSDSTSVFKILDTFLSLFLVDEEKLEDERLILDLQNRPRLLSESQEGLWRLAGWGPVTATTGPITLPPALPGSGHPLSLSLLPPHQEDTVPPRGGVGTP